jgi:hypothetical protein
MQMLVGERKQVSAALLDPVGRRSPTSAFWSSRECRYTKTPAIAFWLAVRASDAPKL